MESNNYNNNGNNGLLSILTREGVLLKVSVHYWRGCKKLRPEDIGLERKNLSDQLISLGHKRLLPKDTLANLAVIEGRAHALVEANTFPFLNGLGHFLPNSKLAEVDLTRAGSDTYEAIGRQLDSILQRGTALRSTLLRLRGAGPDPRDQERTES